MLLISCSAAQRHDQLFSGDATLSCGPIGIEFMNGFVPRVGDRFDLASAGLDPAGADLEVVALGAGVDSTTAFDATGLELTVAGVPAGAPLKVATPSTSAHWAAWYSAGER